MPHVVDGLLLGLLIVATTLWSVFTTLVVPRTTSSRTARALFRRLAKVTGRVVRRLPTYEAKDRLMALIGPGGMMIQFVFWLAALTVGFGLMLWWSGKKTSLGHSILVSGSSVFTLGAFTSKFRASEALEVIAAATGFLVVALEIAYLPSLYSAFSTRETEVTLLGIRGGAPAWGPEILARHHWFRASSELPALYSTWERWTAEMAESHTNFPQLMWFRSPVPWRSWLTAVAAMLDAAALQDAVNPGSAPRQARLFLRMGMQMLRSMADALHIDYDPDPLPTAPIRLTYDEYLVGIERLVQVEFPFERTPEEAWPHFSGWRVNYESIIDALAVSVMAPPTPWMLDRPWVGEASFPVVYDRTPDDPEAQARSNPLL